MQKERPQDLEHITFQDIPYQRHKKDREVLRGTLDFLDGGGAAVRTVPGFPQIRRVYRLKEGVRRLFGRTRFFAEEKLDGYNVRIFRQNERLLAASRGGFICPFTTEWAEIWGEDRNLNRFFRDYPEHVLCGEVIGDNPYNRQRDPTLEPGAHFFVFEIIGPEGRFLPPVERYALVAQYSLPSVPRLGEYTTRDEDVHSLYDVLRELNDRSREGVVLKDGKGERRLKFVTPESDLEDLRDTLQIGFDISSGYFFNRYTRAVIFVKELNLDEGEYAQRIGRAFLDGCPTAGGYSESSEHYRMYVRTRETWRILYEQLQSHILLKEDSVEPDSAFGREMLRVEFRRVYQRSTHRYRGMLAGRLHSD